MLYSAIQVDVPAAALPIHRRRPLEFWGEESEVAAKPSLSPSPASSSVEELLLHPSLISGELSPHRRAP
jgi:hypothetical protein